MACYHDARRQTPTHQNTRTVTSLPKIVVIGGLTASGKTALSLTLSHTFGGEIVNCDSRQLYRGLEIGSGVEPIEHREKDGTVMIDGIRHHLIGFLDPDSPYSLAQFQKDAFDAIDAILKRGNLPFLVGGTGLYIDAVVYNFDLKPERQAIYRREHLSTWAVEKLQGLLEKTEPQLFDELNHSDRANPRRLIRAIEKASRDIPSTSRGAAKYHTLYLALGFSPEETARRIDVRIDTLFDQGLLEENKKLRKAGYTNKLSAMSSIGHREFDAYFDGSRSLDETRALVKLHARQYARRQRTWFKKNKDVHWISSVDEAAELCTSFISSHR